jgi:hypothetical protein
MPNIQVIKRAGLRFTRIEFYDSYWFWVLNSVRKLPISPKLHMTRNLEYTGKEMSTATT